MLNQVRDNTKQYKRAVESGLQTTLYSSFVLLCVFSVSAVSADNSSEVCMYQDEEGVVKQVLGRNKVPADFRPQARCFPVKQGSYLAPPDQITLKGSKREQSMPSSLGRIQLRWPRVVETLFGSTPTRAMSDAARAASRLMKKSGWPTELRRLDQQLNVVFMDENLSSQEIPMRLVSNCHPGWMTPPGNIYIVAQRAAAGCGGGKVRRSEADARLAEVLVHELGHVVEAALLGGKFRGERFRAEGFATWFEALAADESSVIRHGSVRDEHFGLARHYLKGSDRLPPFDGGAGGYAIRSLMFHAIVEKKGVRGLMKVYQAMREQNLGFYGAVQKITGWSQKKLEKKAATLVK